MHLNGYLNVFSGDEERLGMSAMRFELPDDVYDRPENASSETDCYTRPGRESLMSGLTDVSPCYFGKLTGRTESAVVSLDLTD